MSPTQSPSIAIACGGTGGHLFPGIAVANELTRRGCDVTLLISPKEIDQEAVRSAKDMAVETLPAVGLERGGEFAFARALLRSHRAARRLFRRKKPDAVLAMGGFTSAAPVLAARWCRAAAYVHESNAIPGRANRWLSWLVRGAFVGFQCAGTQLHTRAVSVTGTPVRAEFQPMTAEQCRIALGLKPTSPVVLVMGGSQGARAINEMVLQTLPFLAGTVPDLQWVHITGAKDRVRVEQAYSELNVKAVVHAFFARMELALGAATAAISRAGASSLAELAAMRLPAILVPYPQATENHQFHNARQFQRTGAARLLQQTAATPERLSALLLELIKDEAVHQDMQAALAGWHTPRAAEDICGEMLNLIGPWNRSMRPRAKTLEVSPLAAPIHVAATAEKRTSHQPGIA